MDHDKELAQWQVFATLFIALIIKGDFFRAYNDFLNFLVVMAITLNLWYDAYWLFVPLLWQWPAFADFANKWITKGKQKKASVSWLQPRKGRKKLPILYARVRSGQETVSAAEMADSTDQIALASDLNDSSTKVDSPDIKALVSNYSIEEDLQTGFELVGLELSAPADEVEDDVECQRQQQQQM